MIVIPLKIPRNKDTEYMYIYSDTESIKNTKKQGYHAIGITDAV